jgi:hypothetical protein
VVFPGYCGTLGPGDCQQRKVLEQCEKKKTKVMGQVD